MAIIYVDHQTLVKLAGTATSRGSDETADQLRDIVRQAVDELDASSRQIISMFYFESRKINEIAKQTGLEIPRIREIIREGLNRLKHLLADEASRRWTGRVKVSHCPVCLHPRRLAIEAIIQQKKTCQSWARINRRLLARIGRRFNPPSLLVNHLKYHMKG